MAKLIVFNQVTADGYFTDANGDMSWAHGQDDPEWKAFVEGNASGSEGGTLLFGRVTYEMMASYWPTPEALKQAPVVAERMNGLKKVVFSRTLKEASWPNATLAKGDLESEVRKLKEASGSNVVIFGSGNVVSQLTPLGLIDEYQMVIHPVVIGQGRTMFEGMKAPLRLRRRETRAFTNGNVLVCYEPA